MRIAFPRALRLSGSSMSATFSALRATDQWNRRQGHHSWRPFQLGDAFVTCWHFPDMAVMLLESGMRSEADLAKQKRVDFEVSLSG
jgi:hypothetical protein